MPRPHVDDGAPGPDADAAPAEARPGITDVEELDEREPLDVLSDAAGEIGGAWDRMRDVIGPY